MTLFMIGICVIIDVTCATSCSFTAFVANGAEDFLAGRGKDAHIGDADHIHIVLTDDVKQIVMWQPKDEPYEVSVEHAGTGKKFAGMKQFEEYEVGRVRSRRPLRSLLALYEAQLTCLPSILSFFMF
jgi:hypothetical protein